MAAPTDNSTSESSTNLSEITDSLPGEGVIIDIGTGDGRFVYQSARRNPRKFYIGIDPNVRPLEKISEKIYRKPAKPKYAAAGFEVTERGILPASEWPEFETSWAKRLQQNEQRPITYLIARAV